MFVFLLTPLAFWSFLKCSCQQSVCRHSWQVSLPRKDPESYLESCGKSYPIQKHKKQQGNVCWRGPTVWGFVWKKGGGDRACFFFGGVWNQGINESTFISLFFSDHHLWGCIKCIKLSTKGCSSENKTLKKKSLMMLQMPGNSAGALFGMVKTWPF